MQRSESVKNLMAALVKAQPEFTAALKNSENPAFKSKYADLGSVITAVRPALNKHGIVLLQLCESDTTRQTTTVTTYLYCGDEWVSFSAEAPAKGIGEKYNVQTMGAAWTYLKRYTLQGLLGIPSEDDDGNSLAVNNAPTPVKSYGTMDADELGEIVDFVANSKTLATLEDNYFKALEEAKKANDPIAQKRIIETTNIRKKQLKAEVAA
jgi:hypothetical protein